MSRILLALSVLGLATWSASAQYALQFGASVAASGDQFLVGEGRNLLLPGSLYVFASDGNGAWNQVQTLSSGSTIADGFGQSLAVSGRHLVVGAPKQGALYRYRRDDDGTWQLADKISGEDANFGRAVATDDERWLASSGGGPGQDSAVHSSGGGHFEGGDRDGYGSVLAMQDEYAAIGAPDADSRKGAVHILKWESDRWIDAGRLDAGELESGTRFGRSLVFAGQYLAVASAPRSGGGGIRLYARDESDHWQHERTLTRELAAENRDDFGAALAYADGHLYVGAPVHGESEGLVYAFDLSNEGETVTIRPDDLQYRSNFGASVAASEGLITVGAVGHDNFEGVAYPIRVVPDGFAVDAPVFSADSEIPSITGKQVDCERGEAERFPCSDVDMVAFLTRQESGAARGIQVNDVWGWEDPETGREYALVGRTDGTSFIDLTDPSNPQYLGSLPKTATANRSLWRDIKVYKNHAFVVADGAGAHHMQVFDLTQLRDVHAPQVFTESALYQGIYSSHNLIINEETGFAYAVGNSHGGETCGGALHMIDIRDPLNPTFAGCFADTRTGRGSGATHDAQCVTYRGPDADHFGSEICLSSNGNALSIADVTDKENPVALSIAEYPNVAYTHQGWLTEDHRYFYLNDEGDETSGLVDKTRTLIFDLTDLDDPLLAREYFGPSSAIDHNLYIRGDMMYQTNYVEGLRLIDVSDPTNPIEVGHFDTVPYGPNDNSPVLGAWSNYPYFKSGVIVVTSGREGVFFLKRRAIDI